MARNGVKISKYLRSNLDPKVACTACGPGMPGMQMTFVFDEKI
jgi:hypothetical protein